MTENNTPDLYAEFVKNYKVAESISTDSREVATSGPNRLNARGSLENILKKEANGGIITETMQDLQVVQGALTIEESKRAYAIGTFAQDPKGIIKHALADKREKVLKNYLSVAPIPLDDKKYAEILDYHIIAFELDQRLKKFASEEGEEAKEKALAGFSDSLVDEMKLRTRGSASEKTQKWLKSVYNTSSTAGKLAMIQYARTSMKKAIEGALDEKGRIEYAKAQLEARLNLEGEDRNKGIVDAGINLYNLIK